MTIPLYTALARRHAPERFAPTRRDVLRASLAAGAALLAGGCRATPRRSPSAPRVVVIGAGFAGLCCASELTARGVRVDVLEARTRVGGRVHTLHDVVRGKHVEGGGELVGANHPLWQAYAERFHLPLLPIPDEPDVEAPIVMGGRRLSRAESDALWTDMDAAVQRMNDLARAVDGNEPWISADAEGLDRTSVRAWVDALDVEPLVRRAVHAGLASNNGVETSAQSLLAQLAQVKGGGVERFWTDSEAFRCSGGNDRLARALADTLDAGRLHLGARVASIEHGERVVRVACADGRAFEADHVVLALPPSVWPRLRIEPELPAGLRPQMGVSVKYVAALSHRFWRDAGLSQYAFTDGDVSVTWDPNTGQGAGPGAALTSFSSARAASACRSRRGAAQRAAYEAELERLFPGFGRAWIGARFLDWPIDPYAGAGYSFPAPGEVTTVVPRLRAGHGRISFAGEHASSKFVGYMEGALDSGHAVARDLLGRFAVD